MKCTEDRVEAKKTHTNTVWDKKVSERAKEKQNKKKCSLHVNVLRFIEEIQRVDDVNGDTDNPRWDFE